MIATYFLYFSLPPLLGKVNKGDRMIHFSIDYKIITFCGFIYLEQEQSFINGKSHILSLGLNVEH